MSTGRERFLSAVGDMRTRRLPQVSKEYSAINAGYRRMLAKQAGFRESSLDLPLHELDNSQRRALFQANQKIIDLAAKANRLLLSAVIPGL